MIHHLNNIRFTYIFIGRLDRNLWTYNLDRKRECVVRLDEQKKEVTGLTVVGLRVRLLEGLSELAG